MELGMRVEMGGALVRLCQVSQPPFGDRQQQEARSLCVYIYMTIIMTFTMYTYIHVEGMYLCRFSVVASTRSFDLVMTSL